jgi:hypothetical protein
MLGAEAFQFGQFNVGILGPVHGAAGHPPLRAWQTCGQVGASPGIRPLLRLALLGHYLAVTGLPQADRPSLMADYDGVIPTPHHHTGAARHLSDGYQVTRRDPLRARPRELRCVPDGDKTAPGQHMAGLFFDTQHDGAVESRRSQRVLLGSSHPASVPRRPRCAPPLFVAITRSSRNAANREERPLVQVGLFCDSAGSATGRAATTLPPKYEWGLSFRRLVQAVLALKRSGPSAGARPSGKLAMHPSGVYRTVHVPPGT